MNLKSRQVWWERDDGEVRGTSGSRLLVLMLLVATSGGRCGYQADHAGGDQDQFRLVFLLFLWLACIL